MRLSSPWTIRCIEWFVLLSCLLSGLVGSYFRNKPELLPVFIAYNLIFLGFSLFFPAERSLGQRRVYIALEMALIVSAVWLRLWFDLLLYFVLLKSCLLLKRKDVVFIAFFTGIGYLLADAWRTPQRIAETINQLETQGVAAVYDPQAIVIGTLIDYVAVCLFVIWFGFVIVAERKNRERAETLAQEVETLATRLERTRIARDIHDSLGHTLTTLTVQLELAQKLHKHESSEVSQALTTAQTLSQQCLQDVRRSLHSIHQSNFDLRQALILLIKQMEQTCTLHVQLNMQLPPLPLSTSHQLYCIVKEGLTNIQRHAQADSISLESYVTPDRITLTLTDNGKGFDVEHVHSGFGLRGMKERVQIVGGQITINSGSGECTQIQIVIPR